MNNFYLSHHGILGQKWGVKGRKRLYYRNNTLRNRKYTEDVNSIVSSMNNEDKKSWVQN